MAIQLAQSSVLIVHLFMLSSHIHHCCPLGLFSFTSWYDQNIWTVWLQQAKTVYEDNSWSNNGKHIDYSLVKQHEIGKAHPEHYPITCNTKAEQKNQNRILMSSIKADNRLDTCIWTTVSTMTINEPISHKLQTLEFARLANGKFLFLAWKIMQSEDEEKTALSCYMAEGFLENKKSLKE